DTALGIPGRGREPVMGVLYKVNGQSNDLLALELDLPNDELTGIPLSARQPLRALASIKQPASDYKQRPRITPRSTGPPSASILTHLKGVLVGGPKLHGPLFHLPASNGLVDADFHTSGA